MAASDIQPFTCLDTNALEDAALMIRRHSIAAIHAARSGHPGGSLSAADVLAYLYTHEIQNRIPTDTDLDRNRFVLSKGHACPALYAALAVFGRIPYTEPLKLRKLGSSMQGHPHVGVLPWVETSTGSLGQGFSVALGMALGIRHQKGSGRVYVMMGDGEMQEGEVWEAALGAAHHRLANLTAIVDYNKMQSDDLNENILGLEPLGDKWRAFGWRVLDINGHDFDAIDKAITQAKSTTDEPTVIISHTIKGKGVSFMEGIPSWHGSITMRDEDTARALSDLGVQHQDIPSWLNGRVHSHESGDRL